MDKEYFDDFSESYENLMQEQLSSFGDVSYYAEHKIKICKRHLQQQNNILLEYGCGIGKNFPFFKNKLPNTKLFGFDISKKSIEVAQKQNTEVTFFTENEFDLYKNYFDVIFVSNVYHHIPPKYRNQVTQNIYQLLKPEGIFICFEHNPYNPLTRHMVNTCAFDEDAILLKQNEMKNYLSKNKFKNIKANYTLFFPPKLKVFAPLEKYLSFLPLGAQYYTLAQK